MSRLRKGGDGVKELDEDEALGPFVPKGKTASVFKDLSEAIRKLEPDFAYTDDDEIPFLPAPDGEYYDDDDGDDEDDDGDMKKGGFVEVGATPQNNAGKEVCNVYYTVQK